MSKHQGKIAELKFSARAMEFGLVVCWTIDDNQSYDHIVDNGERLLKVQVKSVLGKDLAGNRYQASTNKGRTKQNYSKKDIDYFAIYVYDFDLFYIIPVGCVDAANVSLYPHRASEQELGQYEHFKNAWNLLQKEMK